MGFLSNLRANLREKAQNKAAADDLAFRVQLYETSYEESRSRKPQLPDLATMAELKQTDLAGYADKLDELAHMRSSIDAAYDKAKELQENGLCSNVADPDDVAGAYYKVSEAVHDEWCKANTAKYSDPARTDRQWQFLSAQAIGWDEFRKDAKYSDIVLTAMGYPSITQNERVGETTVEECVQERYEAHVLDYRALPDEGRIQYERDRWVRLTEENVAKYGSKSEQIFVSDMPRAPKDYDYFKGALDIDYNEPAGLTPHDRPDRLMVGHPYDDSDFHDYQYFTPSDDVEKCIAQADERLIVRRAEKAQELCANIEAAPETDKQFAQ